MSNIINNRRQVEKSELTEEQIEHAVKTTYVKGECPQCGKTRIQKSMAGHNIRRDCEECGTTITVVG